MPPSETADSRDRLSEKTDDGSRADLLRRRLGLRDLIAIVMGAIIGVGIFFQPSRVASIAETPGLVLVTWVVGSLLGLAGALTFAELGALFPRTGGQYVILRRAYGRPVAFIYGWVLLTVIQSGAIGIIAMICVRYAGVVVGKTFPAWFEQAGACGLIAMLTLVNVRGVDYGTRIANVTTVLKAITLIGITIVGFLFVGEASPTKEAIEAATPSSPGNVVLIILAGLIPVLFSFGGWQQGTYLAGEVRDPGRTLPRGIVVGVGVVVILYLAFNAGLLAILGVDGLAQSHTPASDAVGAALGATGRTIVALAVAASAFGVAQVCIMTAPRMYKAMADDGCFFATFSRVHPKFETPARAVMLQGGASIVLVLTAGFEGVDYMTTGVVCIDWIFFALTGLSLFVFRRRMADADRPYRVPLYPIVPAIFVVGGLLAVTGAFLDDAKRSASVVAVGVTAAGMLLYPLIRRRG